MKRTLTCLLSLSMLAGPALAQPAELASAVTAALERADGSAAAAQLLREAGVEPGSLTREQVVEAFTPALGAERVAALVESFDREPLGADATAEELTLRAAEGERVAGVFLLAPAAVALVAALAGCAGVDFATGIPADHGQVCRGYDSVYHSKYGYMTHSILRNRVLKECRDEGCGNCRITLDRREGDEFVIQAVGTKR